VRYPGTLLLVDVTMVKSLEHSSMGLDPLNAAVLNEGQDGALDGRGGRD